MSEKTIDLPVAGMTCQSCAKAVEHALGSLESVKSTIVNVAAGQVKVVYDDMVVTPDQLADAIRSAGFDVVQATNSLSIGQARAEAERALRLRQISRLRVGALLTLPIFLISMGRDFALLGSWAHAPWVNWLLFALATPVQFYVGGEYYASAWHAIKNRFASMDVLVAIGATTAYVYSLAILILQSWGSAFEHQHVYFETSATIITLILLGRIVESQAKKRTGAAIEGLLSLQCQTASVVRNLAVIEVPISDVHLNEIVVVRPGQRVPVDGTVKSGSSTIDESMLTGESMPVSKIKGAEVFSGTVNQQGLLHVIVTKVGNNTALARIVAQVEQAQATKAPIQQLADYISNIFVPVVLAVALLTLFVWGVVLGDFSTGLVRMIAVLIISCPCAMGLATPLAVMVGMGRGAEGGILFRSSESLQQMQSIEHIVLDKTGTITTGKMRLTDVVVLPQAKSSSERSNLTRGSLLSLAAVLENASEHPLARAVVEGLKSEVGEPSAILKSAQLKDFAAHPGQGVSGRIDGQDVRIGTLAWLKSSCQELPSEVVAQSQLLEDEAKTVVWLSVDGMILAYFAIADSPKPGSAEAIEQLNQLGLKTSMLTGDNARTAAAIARQVGIQHFDAGVLPAEKAQAIARLQKSPSGSGIQRIAMVGDGINDAPALVQADVGIALGTGTDIAIQSADVTLMRGELTAVPQAFLLSRAVMRVIRQNLFWAFAYNAALIPIAAGVLAGFKFLPIYLRELHPIMAALAMVLSDLVIVVNALRLRRVDTSQARLP